MSLMMGTEIRRIRPEDFDGIVAGHQKQIYRILLAMVRDADVADTLTQECFPRAFDCFERCGSNQNLGIFGLR